MLAEELLAASDHFGVFGERPNLADTLVEHPADPKTDGIADNGAPSRPPVGRPEFQVTETNQRAQTEHDQSAGDDDADDGQRLGHRGQENHGTHPAGMSGDPFEQAADEFGLHGGRVGTGGKTSATVLARWNYGRERQFMPQSFATLPFARRAGSQARLGGLNPGLIPPNLGGPMGIRPDAGAYQLLRTLSTRTAKS